jgi:S-adenosylmethionine-dependent methyltransferase
MADRALFAGRMDAWTAGQALPWNRLRYTLVHDNLCRHLGPAPLRILDAGGGDGRDSVPLAALGHDVVIVDYVPAMLEGARQHAAAFGVVDRVTTILGNVVELDTAFAGAGTAFDLVLCHNVLQYMPAPQMLLDKLGRLLLPGGLLSLLTPNPASESYRLALQQLDFAGALAALDATTYTNVLYGAEVHLFTPAELEQRVAAAGLEGVASYGVRCVIDYVQDNDIKHVPETYAQILELERALSQRSPYRELARFGQLIARRPEP